VSFCTILDPGDYFQQCYDEKGPKNDMTADQLDNRRFMSPDAGMGCGFAVCGSGYYTQLWYIKPPAGSDPYRQNLHLDFDAAWSC
jgi:hypothetical protein